MTWTLETSCGFESRKIKYLLPEYTRGKVLEIGCGMEKAYPHFVGYDSGHHFGQAAADVVGDAADLSQFLDGAFDAVFSSHVLEHLADPRAALEEWWRVIKVGGYLILYLPHKRFYPNIGHPGANPDHKHDFLPEDVLHMMRDVDPWWELCEAQERNGGDEYSFFQVFRKRNQAQAPAGHDFSARADGKAGPAGSKTACVCRFGGFGDMLQAAVVFPQLKMQGYHVTVMTTPKGQDVLKEDPFIDAWYIVDQDQIPNHELFDFWDAQAQRFDRFVNLSESIEGTLLALPGRVNHAWPHAVRKKRMNLNYHEWTAELAGVDFKPARLFWPTGDEIEAVNQQIDRQRFNVLWGLAGSSIHKFTPHMDAVIARLLLEIPELKLFLVGDEACRILEQGWEETAKINCLSGKMQIRETLALAQYVDLVIGPETGVLNAVGMDALPHKILMLSHSSKNNLAKHWKNVQALTPEDCDCYPCHRLHYSADYCSIDAETGSAKCAVNISPYVLYEAVAKIYRNWQRGKLK